MKSKKNNAIVIALSKDLMFSAGTLIINLEDKMKGVIDEYVVIHDGIDESDKEKLSSLAPVRFIHYDKPDGYFKNVDSLVLNQFTKLVFAKFECLKLLQDYKNIIMTDTDVVIYEDISALFLQNEYGIKFLFSESSVATQFKHSIDGYDMAAKAMGAGIIVFHDNLKNYDALYSFCYQSLEHFGSSVKMPEQAIFDLMIQEYKIEPEPIDNQVYCRLPKDVGLAGNYKILHSAGQPKFWSGLKNEKWERYYEEWLKLGGSRFKDTKLLVNTFAPVGSYRRKLIQVVYHYFLIKKNRV